MQRQVHGLAIQHTRARWHGLHVLFATASILAWASSVAVAQPIKVADEHPLSITAPDADSGLSGDAWRATIQHPGSSYIALHFVDFDLAEGDVLSVADADGGQHYTMTHRGKMDAGTFWAQHIKGDTVVLSLIVGGESDSHFGLDRYAAGYPGIALEPLLPRSEAICGDDDRQNAACYRDSHATEYEHARAVARLVTRGTEMCTGWLASDENHLITNEHCIASASDALNTDFEFMAEAPSCGSENCRLCHPGDVYSGATMLRTNANLDYTIVQIDSGDPAASHGYLEIDPRSALPGEQIYIPQHPNGRAKEFGIASSSSGDDGLCRIASTSEPPCIGTGYQDVSYFCDTEGGSSGSPVLSASDHKVIALHHCASCQNQAVPIDLVYEDVKDLLPAVADEGFRLLSPPHGAPVTIPPILSWSRGDNEIFVLLSLFNYEGLGYRLHTWLSLGGSYAMPQGVFDRLAKDDPCFWIVLGFDLDDYSWALSRLWSFTPQSSEAETATLFEPQVF
jgi:V8-like Glu-specific endopeptidase